MIDLIRRFAIDGEPVSCKPHGCGHVNKSFCCTCSSGKSYILQRINTYAFPHPEALMENIQSVTRFLAERTDDPRASLHLVPALDGSLFYVDADQGHWRVYNYIDSTFCLQSVEKPEDFYHAGLAFGRFQQQLADYPAQMLHESIENFHNTPERYHQLRSALDVNYENRAAVCQSELSFAWAREAEAGAIVDALANGLLPLRVTHNDTKLNNILFDRASRRPLCIVDLDTVMPGSSLYDYGDSIRFGASTAAEDEKDLNKVACDTELFRTFTEGFLAGCNGSLTQTEIEMLPIGAKLMTLECGIRFLADYLSGDVYFHIDYPEQNLDRARTQLKLVADMEAKWDTLKQIVAECAK